MTLHLKPVLALAALTALSVLRAAAQSYTFQTFHVPYPPHNNTHGLAINNRGAIVGSMDFRHRINGYPGSATRGFKRDADGVYEYPIIAPQDNAYVTSVQGINDSGVMVGYCFDLSNNYHGFLYRNGVFTAVDPFGAGSVIVFGINNSGDFVGTYGESGFPINGFVSRSGVIAQVAYPGAQATEPVAIAADGTIVGNVFFDNQPYFFILGPNGNFRRFRIAVAGTDIREVEGINSAAHLIVGFYYDQSNYSHGFTYDYLSQSAADVPDGAEVPVNTLDYPGALYTYVNGVNGSGQIVGQAVTGVGPQLGFVATPAQ